MAVPRCPPSNAACEFVTATVPHRCESVRGRLAAPAVPHPDGVDEYALDVGARVAWLASLSS